MWIEKRRSIDEITEFLYTQFFVRLTHISNAHTYRWSFLRNKKKPSTIKSKRAAMKKCGVAIFFLKKNLANNNSGKSQRRKKIGLL